MIDMKFKYESDLSNNDDRNLNYSFINFVANKKNSIFIYFIYLVFLSLFLYSKSLKLADVSLISMGFVFIIFLSNFIEYKKRSNYKKEVLKSVNALDKKYLLTECIDKGKGVDDKFYYAILRIINKNFLEEVSKIRRNEKEYREYIEKWVHEVKTPISAIQLILENNKNEAAKDVLLELDLVENYIEQTLFYARSEFVEKDYFVREINLEKCIQNIIIKNKRAFILNNISLEIDNLNFSVYCDEKWLDFIIAQIISNSIKYKNDKDSEIKIFAKEISNGICLEIIDNGKGIKECDLGRVFEKGFTGSKGRENKNSTGIGLYLVKNLCDKLGLYISISSEYGKYTKCEIVFPKGTFSSKKIFC